MSIEPSLAGVALAKAQRARGNIDTAEVELKAANATLERAIPAGNVAEIRRAHDRTQKAEEAVVKAGQELEVVEIALDVARGHASRLV